MKVEQQRKYINKYLMNDTCQLQPQVVVNGSDAIGAPTYTVPALRSYNGSTTIPCRADTNRAFYNDRLKEQALVTDPITLDLPHDCPVEESDTVLFGGRTWKIRRVYDRMHNFPVRELLLMSIN